MLFEVHPWVGSVSIHFLNCWIGFCCMTITFCSSSHQLIDIWIIFTRLCQVCVALFSFSLGTYLGVLLLAFMMFVFNFLRSCHILFHHIYIIYLPTSNVWRVWFLHVLTDACCFIFLVKAILVGVKWYLIVALICISQMANDVEHLFMFLWLICVYSLVKSLVISFAHLFNWVFLFFKSKHS